MQYSQKNAIHAKILPKNSIFFLITSKIKTNNYNKLRIIIFIG